MAAKFFDTEPVDWQELEKMTHLAFVEMGYDSSRALKIETIRGSVAIDVHAVKKSSPIPTVVLCECKHWNTPVPQTVVHAFRTVCADAGAHFGLIISKCGFQAGAEKSRLATNVHLMDFDEFQATFFEEWRSGVFMLFVRMRDQLLPILRGATGMRDGGLDLVDANLLDGVRPFEKYSLFFGGEGHYSKFFIEDATFPAVLSDPRGDPRSVKEINVKSHREYVEIAKDAISECNKYFSLPLLHFDNNGAAIQN